MGMHDGNEVHMYEQEFEGKPLFIVVEVIGLCTQEPSVTRDKDEAERWVKDIIDQGMSVEDYT